MGRCHVELSLLSESLCAVAAPWGKCQRKRLPAGLCCNSPDIFQECASELFTGFDFVRACIDDLLIASSSTFEGHLAKLEAAFARLSEAGLKVSAKKSAL